MELFQALLALIPAVVLGIYIFMKDRAEKEPIGLLLLLFGVGALIGLPAGFIESAIESAIIAVTGGDPGSGVGHILYQLLFALLVPGLVEEGLKWGALLLITRKNKNFNSLFDGVIYAVFVSLGFAALENVGYVLIYGWSAMWMRFVTAVPAHMFFAVIMGFFYSLWHCYGNAAHMEDVLMENGSLPEGPPKIRRLVGRNLVLSIAAPILVHGFYDFCLFTESTVFLVIFLIGLVALYIICFRLIRRMSKNDADDGTMIMRVLVSFYPSLQERFAAAAQPQNSPQAPAQAYPQPQYPAQPQPAQNYAQPQVPPQAYPQPQYPVQPQTAQRYAQPQVPPQAYQQPQSPVPPQAAPAPQPGDESASLTAQPDDNDPQTES